MLRRTQETSKAKGVTAVILDPATGGVLAMASSPGPGADGYRKATAEEQRIRAITDQYEPGSTFKAVTVAAGLAERRFGPLTTIDVPPVFKLYEYPISDAHPNPSTMTVADILKVSSNVGTARLAYEYLSGSKGDADHGRLLARWIDRLGFGARTGIDLPGETAGAVLPYNRWSGTSILNIPIGYGTAVTPIQLASLYATIANGGVAVRPHLAARVGERPPLKPKAERLLPERVAKQLTQMLVGVVQEDGTGHQAAIPGYTVAGKTGTTKKIDADGTYSDTRYVAWFVGFAPAHAPAGRDAGHGRRAAGRPLLRRRGRGAGLRRAHEPGAPGPGRAARPLHRPGRGRRPRGRDPDAVGPGATPRGAGRRAPRCARRSRSCWRARRRPAPGGRCRRRGRARARRPGRARLMPGGSRSCTSAISAATASIPPAAPRQWPCEPFVEETGTAPSPARTSVRASAASPTGVEVAWAFT